MRRTIRIFLYTGLLLFLLWSFLVASIYIDSVTQQKERADAVVVMGASQWNGRPSPALRDRLDHAYDIYRDGLVKYIVLTGGIARGDSTSESAVGKKYLVSKGVPGSIIFIEEKGHTTLESMKEVKKILSNRNIHSVIFVSHGYHLHRVRKMAEDMGIRNVRISAVSIKNDSKKIKLVLRESLVYVVYLMRTGYSAVTS